MTNQEITEEQRQQWIREEREDKFTVERAIQRAIDNGFWNDGYAEHICWGAINTGEVPNWSVEDIWKNYVLDMDYEEHVTELLYNHEFCKALWGKSPVLMDIELQADEHPIYTDQQKAIAITKPAWQYHLQQMVIADDPIAYLGENI